MTIFQLLKCVPINVSYDYIDHSGKMELKRLHCTDMSGCIRYFKRIDPKVRYIYTYSAGMTGTVYEKFGDDWRVREVARRPVETTTEGP